MITCPSCGAEAGAADRFCAHCGSELTSDRVFTCPSCGAEAGATDKFCVNCGSGLIVYRSTKTAEVLVRTIYPNGLKRFMTGTKDHHTAILGTTDTPPMLR